jgi:ERCC4-type nuclease
MFDEFVELCITIDSREHDQKRIDIIKSWGEEHGAIVDIHKLEFADYQIEGIFRGVPINLGVQYKTLSDFASSYEGIPDNLFNQFKYHSEVALFVEDGAYTIKSDESGLDGWIQNIPMQNVTGAEGTIRLSTYKNFCESMSHAGIHVRQFRTSAHFPYELHGLIVNLAKPTHNGISIKSNTFYSEMMNIMAKLPGIGAKKAEKGLKYIPNLEMFNSMSEEDLQDIFGKVEGKKLWQFKHEQSRINECAENWKQFYAEKLNKRIPEAKAKKGVDLSIPTQDRSSMGILTNPIQKSQSSIEDSSVTEGDTTLQSSEVKPSLDTSGAILSPNIHISPSPDVESNKNTGKGLAPSVRDVLEYIRQEPRCITEIGKYFGFTPEYTFKLLYDMKTDKKIHYEGATRKWFIGQDFSPMPARAEKEFDVGV